MSKRSSLLILKKRVREARQRAYHTRGLRDRDEIVDYIIADVEAVLSPAILRDALRAYLVKLIGNKFELTERIVDDDKDDSQLDWLNMGSIEGVYRAIRKTKRLIEVADMMLVDAEMLDEQLKGNKDAALNAYEAWSVAFTELKPYLARGLTWGQAIAARDSRS